MVTGGSYKLLDLIMPSLQAIPEEPKAHRLGPSSPLPPGLGSAAPGAFGLIAGDIAD
jgi:hypothetical protein